VTLPASAVATSSASATRAPVLGRHLSGGDAATYDFSVPLIESDLWEQYAGFGGQASSGRPHDGANHFYSVALEKLDGDMPPLGRGSQKRITNLMSPQCGHQLLPA
jgi:hypothetical protein